jgi:hypothetical protein
MFKHQKPFTLAGFELMIFCFDSMNTTYAEPPARATGAATYVFIRLEIGMSQTS